MTPFSDGWAPTSRGDSRLVVLYWAQRVVVGYGSGVAAAGVPMAIPAGINKGAPLVRTNVP